MREVLALAPPERLPRALGILPKDVRRRLAASPRGTIRRVMEGRPSMKKRLGGYTASDWTHSLFSAPSVRYPMSRADRAFMEVKHRTFAPGHARCKPAPCVLRSETLCTTDEVGAGLSPQPLTPQPLSTWSAARHPARQRVPLIPRRH